MTGGVPGGGSVPGYTAPPTMQKKGGSSWLIWLLVGCGGLIVIGIIGVMVLANTFKNNKGFGAITSGAECSQHLMTIRTALDKYQSEKGKYPASLKDLVPNYLPDDSALTCGQDDQGKTREIVYTAPTAKSADDAVVLTVHTGDISFIQTQSQKIYISLLKDGRLVQDQTVRTELRRNPAFKTSP